MNKSRLQIGKYFSWRRKVKPKPRRPWLLAWCLKHQPFVCYGHSHSLTIFFSIWLSHPFSQGWVAHQHFSSWIILHKKFHRTSPLFPSVWNPSMLAKIILFVFSRLSSGQAHKPNPGPFYEYQKGEDGSWRVFCWISLWHVRYKGCESKRLQSLGSAGIQPFKIAPLLEHM